MTDAIVVAIVIGVLVRGEAVALLIEVAHFGDVVPSIACTLVAERNCFAHPTSGLMGMVGRSPVIDAVDAVVAIVVAVVIIALIGAKHLLPATRPSRDQGKCFAPSSSMRSMVRNKLRLACWVTSDAM